MRTCSKCGADKPLDEFYLLASGWRRTDCKACCSGYAKARPGHAYEPDAEKACTKCGETKRNTEFSRNKNGRLGTRSWCKACFKRCTAGDNSARYWADPEAARKRYSDWSAQNKDRILANTRTNRARRPEHYRALRMDRYLRECGAQGSGVSPAQWSEILEYHDHRCAYCLQRFAALQLDHVIALSRGGEHDPSNVVPACVSCNSSKKDKAMFEIFNPRLLVAQRSA